MLIRISFRYIYFDEINVGIQSFVSTFVAAEKYAIRTFVKALIDKIKHFSGDETCIMLKQLEYSKVSNKEFQIELTKKYQFATKKIIASNEFLHLNSDTLKELMCNLTLNVKEIEIFDVILKWAKNQCLTQHLEMNALNLKRTISRLIYLFDYTSMNLNEFANKPGKLKLLADNELVDLFLWYTLTDKQAISLPKQLIQIKRSFPPSYYLLLIEDGEDEHFLGRPSERAFESIDLKVNKEIYLKGIELKSSCFEDERRIKGSIIVSMKIDCGKELISMEEIAIKLLDSNYYDKNDVTFKNLVQFDCPVLIEADRGYKISMHYKKTISYHFKNLNLNFDSANVHFNLKTDTGLCFMKQLIFHKF